MEKSLKLVIGQSDIETGRYKVKVHLFASVDGLYFGGQNSLEEAFYIDIFGKDFGFKVDIDDSNRTVYKQTGKTLEENANINCKALVEGDIQNGSLKVILQKRDSTYTGSNYNSVTYTDIDLKDYLTNNLVKYGTNEYVVLDNISKDDEKDFELAVKAGLKTGEYRLKFRLYSGNICIQEVEKTFIVINQ